MVTSADLANLVDEVLWHLTDEPEPVSEHDLLADLAQEEVFQHIEARSAIAKQSQKHFLMMHALYTLRERLIGSEFRLQMRPDAIRLLDSDTPETAEEHELEPGWVEDEALRDYYLDVTQLLVIGNSGMALEDHRQHRNKAERHDLYAALEISWGCDWEDVKSAYRQKAIASHPEKGGDLEQFRRVRHAYNQLKRQLQH